jgi:hypothetical protein
MEWIRAHEWIGPILAVAAAALGYLAVRQSRKGRGGTH